MAENDNLNRATAAIPVEAANRVIEQVFIVGLTLASCVKWVDGPVANRLTTAINDLDAIITGLRKTAFEQVERETNAPADMARRQAFVVDTTALAGELGVVARWADQLSRSAHTDGTDLVRLLDATHTVYRTVVRLASQPF
jgi:hypothetical protein